MAIGDRSLVASVSATFPPKFVVRGTLCGEPLPCEKFLRRKESALPVGIDRRYDPRPRNGPVEVSSGSSAPIEFLPHALPNLGDAKFSGFCHAAKVFDSFSSVGFIAVPLCDEPSRRIVLPPHVLRGIPPNSSPCKSCRLIDERVLFRRVIPAVSVLVFSVSLNTEHS